PGDEDRDRNGDLGGDLQRLVGPVAHPVDTRCEGCQRRIRRSSADSAKWIPTPRKPIASAMAYTSSYSPKESATFIRSPRPPVPMNSSAVKARISATVEAMRRPVQMYGTALGSVILYRRSVLPSPNERPVSLVTGSTSRTP